LTLYFAPGREPEPPAIGKSLWTLYASKCIIYQFLVLGLVKLNRRSFLRINAEYPSEIWEPQMREFANPNNWVITNYGKNPETLLVDGTFYHHTKDSFDASWHQWDFPEETH